MLRNPIMSIRGGVWICILLGLLPARTGGQGRAELPTCVNAYAASLPMRFEILPVAGATHLADSLGAYSESRASCLTVRDDSTGVFYLGSPNGREWAECSPDKATRSWTLDLSHPVAGGGGVDRGKLRSSGMHVRIVVQKDSLGRFVGLRDLKIGTTTEVLYLRLVNERENKGQVIFAPTSPGCSGYTQTPGTTAAKIRRTSATTWEVDLPPGSIGRLKIQSGPGAARELVDHGLYHFTARYRIESAR